MFNNSLFIVGQKLIKIQNQAFNTIVDRASEQIHILLDNY